MVEIGYLAACQTYYQKLVANVSIYDRRPRSNVDYLQTEHFAGAFLILGFGLILASAVFVIEIVADYMKPMESNEPNNKNHGELPSTKLYNNTKLTYRPSIRPQWAQRYP